MTENIANIANAMARARAAQPDWAEIRLRDRLAIFRRFRHLAVEGAAALADTVSLPGRRNAVETLGMEVLPLLDAARFLEREGMRILANRKAGLRGRPAWLAGHLALTMREPFGIVLVLAPFNYPLYLPGVQVLQALAAGNAALVKPAPGHAGPMLALKLILEEAGLPTDMMQILTDTSEAGQQAVEAAPDLIVFTGSARNGKAVLKAAAERAIPAIVELSGNDAVFVLPDADLDMTASALAFGLRLNGGATCIAPRRVYATRTQVDRLASLLRDRIFALPPATVSELSARQALHLIANSSPRDTMAGEAIEGKFSTVIIIDPARDSGLLREDIFAPVLSLVSVADMEDALRQDDTCPLGLAAAVFGPPRQAAALAHCIKAGTVTINDLIAPTADPRLAFEGRRGSGFGATRGAEGLLAMTRPRNIAIRAGRRRLHYTPMDASWSEAWLAYIEAAHGMGHRGSRVGAAIRLIAALWRKRHVLK